MSKHKLFRRSGGANQSNRADDDADQSALPQIGKCLSDEGRLLRAIVENLPDMLPVKEASELKFVQLNRAGKRLLGDERESVLDKMNLIFSKVRSSVLRLESVAGAPLLD